MLKTYNHLLDDYGILKSDHSHITDVGGRSQPGGFQYIHKVVHDH